MVGRGYLRTRGGRSTKVANVVLAFAFCLDKTRVTRNGEPSHLLRGKTRQPSSRCALVMFQANFIFLEPRGSKTG